MLICPKWFFVLSYWARFLCGTCTATYGWRSHIASSGVGACILKPPRAAMAQQDMNLLFQSKHLRALVPASALDCGTGPRWLPVAFETTQNYFFPSKTSYFSILHKCFPLATRLLRMDPPLIFLRRWHYCAEWGSSTFSTFFPHSTNFFISSFFLFIENVPLISAHDPKTEERERSV